MSEPERATPFYCPYCAGEDLRPFEDQHGALVRGEERSEASIAASRMAHGGWECRECTRVFSVKLLGLRVNPRSEVKR
jgi:hypothetical protein